METNERGDEVASQQVPTSMFYGPHKRFMIVEVRCGKTTWPVFHVHDAEWVRDEDVLSGKGSPVVAVFHFRKLAEAWCDGVERGEVESVPLTEKEYK